MEHLTTTTTSATRTISSVPHHRRLFSISNPSHFRFKSALLLQTSLSRTTPELRYLSSPLLRSTSSEKRSSGVTRSYGEEERDVLITLEDESPMDEQTQGFKFLEKLNIQVDSAYTSSILLFGSGALFALWFASAIVGAIDAIPVFPKLMEVVGLAYTFWFSSRYLLFKENRDELAAKIEQIKQQVLGSIED